MGRVFEQTFNNDVTNANSFKYVVFTSLVTPLQLNIIIWKCKNKKIVSKMSIVMVTHILKGGGRVF